MNKRDKTIVIYDSIIIKCYHIIAQYFITKYDITYICDSIIIICYHIIT